MNPLSDFTTPRRLMLPISRHFLPVEQPEPFCCTTGLKNGSRFPFIAHFLSSALGLALSPILLTSSDALGLVSLADCAFSVVGLGAALVATVGVATGLVVSAAVLAATVFN